jgi:hypothetical protein
MELDDDQFGSLCHEILQALHTDRRIHGIAVRRQP